jgi:hypothetical protein
MNTGEGYTEQDLEKALAFLATGRHAEHVAIDPPRIVRINPHNILAHAWNPDRLKACLDTMATSKVDPVYVTRYELDDRKLYAINADGNHRTIAARKLGWERITAWLSCVSHCAPAYHFTIQGDTLLEVPPGSPWWQVREQHLPESVRRALMELGVPEFSGGTVSGSAMRSHTKQPITA